MQIVQVHHIEHYESQNHTDNYEYNDLPYAQQRTSSLTFKLFVICSLMTIKSKFNIIMGLFKVATRSRQQLPMHGVVLKRKRMQTKANESEKNQTEMKESKRKRDQAYESQKL